MFAPWRKAFVEGQLQEQDVVPSPSGCVLCDYPLGCGHSPPDATTTAAWDRRRLIVTARERAFVILNKYPYGNGHVMVVPRLHEENVDQLSDADYAAVQGLLKETISAVRKSYAPDGINVGMNLGAAAGAGIAGHCHWHVLPRWRGDVNFLPVFADTKVIMEALDDSWRRLAGLLRQPGEG